MITNVIYNHINKQGENEMTFTDGTATKRIELIENGIDFTKDFYNVGTLEYDEDNDVYKVDSVEDCIAQAEDYLNHDGDYREYENYGHAELYVNSLFVAEEVEAPAYITFTCTDGEEVTIDVDDIETLIVNVEPSSDACGIRLKDETLYYPDMSYDEVKEMIEEARA